MNTGRRAGAAERARLESAKAPKGVSWVQIPTSPNFLANKLGFERSRNAHELRRLGAANCGGGPTETPIDFATAKSAYRCGGAKSQRLRH